MFIWEIFKPIDYCYRVGQLINFSFAREICNNGIQITFADATNFAFGEIDQSAFNLVYKVFPMIFQCYIHVLIWVTFHLFLNFKSFRKAFCFSIYFVLCFFMCFFVSLCYITMKCIATLIEITLWNGFSPVNLLHIFRTTFLRNTSEWLLLCYHGVISGNSNEIIQISLRICRKKLTHFLTMVCFLYLNGESNKASNAWKVSKMEFFLLRICLYSDTFHAVKF